MLAQQWDVARIVILLSPGALVLLAVLVGLLMRKTLRTRVRVGKQLRDDPDINEWLVVFNWSRKVLYVPTIIASVAAAVIMAFIRDADAPLAYVLGGVWMAVFLVNFLIDEYELSIKLLLIFVLCVALLFLWLHLLGWVGHFLGFFKRLGVSMNCTGYLLMAGVFTLAVVLAWIRGLFYYVAITPNYLNIQVGPTETGEQIAREEYSTRVDTGDFLERLLGFGRLIITFADHRRQPMILLVWRIGAKAQQLEAIRGKLAWDRRQSAREGQIDSV